MYSDLLQSFYWCYTESVLTFSFISWFGGLRVKNKSKLNKVVNVTSKIVGRQLCSPSDLHERRVIEQSMKIIGNISYILASQYQILQSGKHYRVPQFKTVRGKPSFTPTSIKLLNKNHWAHWEESQMKCKCVCVCVFSFSCLFACLLFVLFTCQLLHALYIHITII